MNVIFLDIDGVLNNINTPMDEDLDETLVERLIALMRYRNAAIVLSSSWRMNPKAIYKLRTHKFMLDIDFYAYLSSSIEDKGLAINQFLKDNERIIDNYVILDDEDNELYNKNHFVQTTFEKGLDNAALKKALDILSSSKPKLCCL